LEQGPDLEYDAKLFAHSAGRDKPYHTPSDTTAAVVSPITTPPKSSDADRPSINHVEKVAMAVRRRVLEYTIFNNGGYLSQACSSAETLVTLYLRALNLGPSIADPIPADFRGSPGPNIETMETSMIRAWIASYSLRFIMPWCCILYSWKLEDWILPPFAGTIRMGALWSSLAQNIHQDMR